MRKKSCYSANNIITQLLLFCFLITCCSGQHETTLQGIGTIDLSSTDSLLVFSWFRDGKSSIYTGEITGDGVVRILSSESDTSYVRPKFSHDGKKILFLAFPKGGASSSIIVLDLKSRKKRQITFQTQLISEATFSTDDKEIYFLKAGVYEKYSPIGRTAPHEFDIYKIGLDNLKEIKITNFRAYGMNNLTEILGKYFLLRIEQHSHIGNSLISLSDPSKIQLLIPSNDPRGSSDMYYDPTYSSKFNKIAFTAPYELYVMDLDSLKAQLVYGPKNEDISHINNVLIFNTANKILFKKETEINAFYTINFDGSGLRKVKLVVEN